MNAVNAARPDIAPLGHTSLRARLDLLLQRAITLEDFETDVARLCQANAEEVWAVLALLDQYHRRGLLPTPLFRTLKASADRRGLGRQGGGPSRPAPAPTPTLTPAPAAAAAAAPASAAVTAPTPAPAPRPAVPPGTIVLRNRYVLEAQLGLGRRSTVYRALDRTRSKLPLASQYVALKVLHANATTDADALASLRAEFHCAQSLSHPNIVNVLELDLNGPLIFMTMELLDGESLDALLARRRAQPLPHAMALAIIRDVGAALVHAHERGVVHGDLQPRHIMITESGEVRVIDFAAARTSSDNSSPETNAYASCEALEGQVADRRDDLYSLACLSFELLAGRHPFNRLSAAQARGRALLPRRPKLVRSGPWQALRAGLAWRRENRTVGIGWWLARMGLGKAAARLPTLEQLAVLPPPRRRRFRRPLALAACLGATIATAAVLGRLPTAQRVSQGWQELRAARFANPLRTLGDWLSPTASTAVATDHKSATTGTRHALVVASGSRRGRISVAASKVPATVAPAIDVPADSTSTSDIVEASAVPAAAPVSAPAALPAPAAPLLLELAADSYTVLPGEPAARIEVRRRGNLHGDVSFVWSTESASALPERDFIASGPRAEQMPAGVSSVTLLVPIVSDATRGDSRVFYVTITEPGGGAELGTNSRAAVLVAGGG